MKLSEALLLYLKHELDLTLFLDIVRDNESNDKIVNEIEYELKNRKEYILFCGDDPVAIYSSKQEANNNLPENNENQSHNIGHEHIIDSMKWRKLWNAALILETNQITTYEIMIFYNKDALYNNTSVQEQRKNHNFRYIQASSFESREDAIKQLNEMKKEPIAQ